MVYQEDYFDAASGAWDLDGLKDDLHLAKALRHRVGNGMGDFTLSVLLGHKDPTVLTKYQVVLYVPLMPSWSRSRLHVWQADCVDIVFLCHVPSIQHNSRP